MFALPQATGSLAGLVAFYAIIHLRRAELATPFREAAVITSLEAAGFVLEARLDRQPYPNAEHPSERCYVLARAA